MALSTVDVVRGALSALSPVADSAVVSQMGGVSLTTGHAVTGDSGLVVGISGDTRAIVRIVRDPGPVGLSAGATVTGDSGPVVVVASHVGPIGLRVGTAVVRGPWPTGIGAAVAVRTGAIVPVAAVIAVAAVAPVAAVVAITTVAPVIAIITVAVVIMLATVAVSGSVIGWGRFGAVQAGAHWQ